MRGVAARARVITQEPAARLEEVPSPFGKLALRLEHRQQEAEERDRSCGEQFGAMGFERGQEGIGVDATAGRRKSDVDGAQGC